MSGVRVRAYAKLNLFLHVGARREDGFHPIESLFQTISLHDELEIDVADEFRLTCSDPSLPTDRRNLVTRAFWAMREAFGVPTVSVRLTKRIPAGGGLGGGSSDAAAVLRAMGPLLETEFDGALLHDVAASLGSDVPFFLTGGTALCSGRGELVAPLPDTPLQSLSVVLPPYGVETARCYATLARLRQEGTLQVHPFAGEERARTLATLPLRQWPREARRNDLEPAAFELTPALEGLLHSITSADDFSLMSGSGSTLFTTGAVADLPPEVRTERVTTVGRVAALLVEQ